MKTVFYAGYSNPKITRIGIDKFVNAARIVGYNLMPFEGYTRFNGNQQQRDDNLAAIREVQKIVRQRTGNRTLRIWDVADEETIRHADAEWMSRHNSARS